MKSALRILAVAALLVAGPAITESVSAKEESGRPWMGVQIHPVEGEEGRAAGIFVDRVVPGSPAEKAGLRRGDVLTAVGRTKLPDLETLFKAMQERRPGDVVVFVVRREDKLHEMKLRLGTMPADIVEESELEERQHPLAAERDEIAAERELLGHAMRELAAGILETDNRERLAALVERLQQTALAAGRLDARLGTLIEEMARIEESAGGRRWEQEELGAGRERRAQAERHIEILRLAWKSLNEWDRPDLAEKVERKIHAIDLSFSGRKDREAIEIIEGAPNDGQMAEILGYAAKLHAEKERRDAAEACRELSRHYGEIHRDRQRAHEAEESEARDEQRRRLERDERERIEHEARARRERDEDARREREIHREREAKRVEMLRMQIAELRRALESLEEQIRDFARERK